jgi:hypothetical protein
MRLRQLASTAFVLFSSDMPAGHARDVVLSAAGSATHVVVEGPAPGTWHLLTLRAAADLLADAPPGASLAVALHLADRLPAPVVDGDAEVGPATAVVLVEGRVHGFVDRGAARAEPASVGAESPLVGAEPRSVGAERPGFARAKPPGLARAEPATAGAGPVRRGAGGGSRQPGPATPPGGGAAPEPARALEAEFPDRVRVDTVAWLLVYITSSAPTGHGLGFQAAAGETIDVVVQPRARFALDGDDRGTLAVPASGESLPLQFKLKATDTGVGAIRVLAFMRGQPLGAISFEPVVEPAEAPHARSVTVTAPRASTALEASSPQLPDLTMFVEEWQAGGDRQYRILLSALDPALGLNLSTYGPFSLRLDPGQFFADLFKEIDELPLDTPAQRDAADRKVAAKGAYLSDELLPDELRQILWEVRDQVQSVIVQSEEPWIPWELCKLVGRDGDRVVEGPFLCEAFTITRWLPGVGFKRPLRLANLALVVPEDSGLPLALAERDYVMSLKGAGREVTPVTATYASVQDAFAAGSYDGWHFTGHGAARDDNTDRSAILLAGGDTFTPESISGLAANVGVPHPVVFINACQAGRTGMALTGIGGWASRFVRAGAGAFIGAHWSVIDEPAFGFAREVYSRLLAGVPIGRAVRDARLAIRTPGDPTWLAYTVFADPLAVIGEP